MNFSPVAGAALSLFVVCQIYGQSVPLKNTASAPVTYLKDSVVVLDPPVYGFYSKYLSCEGIAIRSSQIVDNRALYVASAKIRKMLMHMQPTLKNLVKNGAELHIIGKDQQTSDLPEFMTQKGVTYLDNGIWTDIDKRTRGMGGTAYASCGEENLLGLPGDRYPGGYDICMHEFSHTIMNIGFDSLLRKKIEVQYKNALAKGLWKGVYAATNKEEYFAELTTWYFGSHGDYTKQQFPVPGPKALHDYDTDGYNLLDSIYSGLIQPQVSGHKASVVVSAGVPSGVSAEAAKLSVFNNRSAPLKLFWIDLAAQPKFYKTIAAHQRFVQPTFLSDVWMVEDENDKVLLYIKVNDPVCDLQLNP